MLGNNCMQNEFIYNNERYSMNEHVSLSLTMSMDLSVHYASIKHDFWIFIHFSKIVSTNCIKEIWLL